jgi:hypothetical protein
MLHRTDRRMPCPVRHSWRPRNTQTDRQTSGNSSAAARRIGLRARHLLARFSRPTQPTTQAMSTDRRPRWLTPNSAVHWPCAVCASPSTRRSRSSSTRITASHRCGSSMASGTAPVGRRIPGRIRRSGTRTGPLTSAIKDACLLARTGTRRHFGLCVKTHFAATI